MLLFIAAKSESDMRLYWCVLDMRCRPIDLTKLEPAGAVR